MVGVGREDLCSLALTLRHVRRLRGMKQAHAAELLGVTQSTVSRIERGELKPAGILRNRLLDLVSARIHPARDAALRRLIEGSATPVHLVCDLTHRLLAASRPRERVWRRAHALTFATGANGSDELIASGVLVWERILLSDGAPARLVSSTAEGAVI
jgi:transcriptional regulator with XRE-family HTH domain